MFSLSIKIWWKGVIVFAIACAIGAIPTFGLALVGLIIGIVISLPSIFLYNVVIFILKKSEAASSYAIYLLFITTVFAVLFALELTVFFGSNPFDFQLNKFYSNPAFFIPWFCAALGIRFSRKHIRAFFNEENLLESN